MKSTLNVGVVGATGLVGETFLALLEERKFPVQALRLFASDRSLGRTRRFQGRDCDIETLQPGCFRDLDLVFFSSGDEISKTWAPQAVAAGAYAVDNSAAFRNDPEKLLVVPEVNGHLLNELQQPALIANPNCSTIQLVVALAPLHKDFGVKRVHVASYQAVSGAGKAGQDELRAQMAAVAKNQDPQDPQTFPHPIVDNCIPQIGSFQDNGFCTEELKIMRETKKILDDTNLSLSAFTVRIPAWNSHSEAVWVRLKRAASREDIVRSLRRQPGLSLIADPSEYRTAVEMNGQDPVSVSRLHQDSEDPQTWLMWIVADNLRKGAALNGIQIAEKLCRLL